MLRNLLYQHVMLSEAKYLTKIASDIELSKILHAVQDDLSIVFARPSDKIKIPSFGGDHVVV